jgi:prepilin-type N-terminal cleavage/methylation domain-containing protein
MLVYLRLQRRLRALGHRCRREDGLTLIELLTSMTILSTVIGALTALFISGANAELNLNKRFQAQQDAALALKMMRPEIHCAKKATTTGQAITLTLDSYCRGGPATVIWCTAPLAGERFGLFRAGDGACDGSDARWADFLTQGSIFTLEQPAESLEKIGIVLPVDLEPDKSPGPYRIEDAIVLRNSVRAAAAP